MRKRSIKTRVTLWYTIIVAVVLGVVFGATIVFVNEVGISQTEEDLQGNVTGFMSEIDVKNDTYYLDGDTEFHDDGVMFCIYNDKGQLLHGTMPVNFSKDTKLQSHNTRIVRNSKGEWMVYDATLSYGNGKALWIRGITSVHSIETVIDTIVKVTIVSYPLLIFLIAFVGYQMTKRALKPVDQLRKEVERINEGNDLSKRLPMLRTKDEIYYLTEAFNEMFGRLQQSFENEKQFTADASHELRTPVAVLISQCEYLLEKGNLTQEQKEDVQVILKQSRRMSKLISQMLTLARGEQMKNIVDLEEIDLAMMTEIVIEELQEKAEKKNIALDLNITGNVTLQGDQTLCMRLMMNLIENAIRYGREDGFVHVKLWEEPESIYGEVEDNGIGISEENLDKIWHRFYRVDKSRSESGTGLGLSMVKWIVEVHGGTVRVESKPQIGTKFSFRLQKNN